MIVRETRLREVLVLEPRVFADARGFFLESYNARGLQSLVGRAPQFVQDNHSRSGRGVLRGLHYQVGNAQAKLVRVVTGAVFDVAVDVRRSSPTFGQWVGEVLSADNHRQMWIPEGFAHGFLVLTEHADCLYKTSDYYAPEAERGVIWSDPDIGIDWPLDGAQPRLSGRDAANPRLLDADTFP